MVDIYKVGGINDLAHLHHDCQLTYGFRPVGGDMKKEMYITSIETVGDLRKALQPFMDECEIGIKDGSEYTAIGISFEIDIKTGIGKLVLT